MDPLLVLPHKTESFRNICSSTVETTLAQLWEIPFWNDCKDEEANIDLLHIFTEVSPVNLFK